MASKKGQAEKEKMSLWAAQQVAILSVNKSHGFGKPATQTLAFGAIDPGGRRHGPDVGIDEMCGEFPQWNACARPVEEPQEDV